MTEPQKKTTKHSHKRKNVTVISQYLFCLHLLFIFLRQTWGRIELHIQ